MKEKQLLREDRLTDFKELQKQRRKTRVLRRLAIFALICVCVMGVFTLSRQFQDFSLGAVVQGFWEQGKGDGLPINLSSGAVQDLQEVDGNIGLLGESSFCRYSTDGKRLQEVRHNYYNPAMEVGDNRVLLYDRDGNNLQVVGNSKTLFSRIYENSIITASLNSRGFLAVATNSQRFKGEVFVYNRGFENIFNWGCASGRILCMDLADQDNRMAVGTVETTGGMLRSTVNLFKFTSDEEVAKVNLDDQLLLSLDYKGKENTLYAITNKNVYALSADGAILAKWSFGGETLWAFANEGNSVAVALGDYREQRQLSLYRLDTQLNASGPVRFNEHMLGLTISGEDVYLLADNLLYRYDSTMQLTNTYDLPDAKQMLPLKGKVYYATSSRLNVALPNQ